MYYLPLYVTVLALSLVITIFAEIKLIPILKNRAKQPIYEGGPSWHLSKSGTPTMGGLAFLIAATLALSIAIGFLLYTGNRSSAVSLLLALSFSVANALIGILDDATKLARKENAGLSPKQKLLLQFLLSALFLTLRKIILSDTTVLRFSFGSLDLGIFYYPFAIVMLLGIVNCANLTDGVDGLAACTGLSAGGLLLMMSISISIDSALISICLIGICLAFLFFNAHPAKVFMGDTGSLFLGALVASCSFSIGNPLISVFVGIVYVLEGISVILQVLFYKTTRKRLFKMAPFHHHLERSGFSENKICVLAIVATVLLSIPAFALF